MIFGNQGDKSKSHLTFFAAFHLGVPLAVCETPKSTGWDGISDEISYNISLDSRFESTTIKYHPDTHFPLGQPISIRYRDFERIFDTERYLADAGIHISKSQYSIENLIWICPSGIVLVMGELTFAKRSLLSLGNFEDEIVEKHYAELTYIFSEVAESVLEIFPTGLLKSSLVSRSDLEKIEKAIAIRRNSNDENNSIRADKKPVAAFLTENKQARAHFEEILIDVYYVDWRDNTKRDKININYVDSSVETSDSTFPLLICIAFSSFTGLLWLQKHLGEQAMISERGLVGPFRLPKEIAYEFKVFRILCLRFIDESSPTRIRLERVYVEPFEICWKEFRMHVLVNYVNDQLATLEKMFDWIDEIEKESRNLKIGIAGVLLALLSITAVAATLVSTIDVNSELGWRERLIFIFIGLIIGALSTLAIYFFPVKRRIGRSAIIKIRKR